MSDSLYVCQEPVCNNRVHPNQRAFSAHQRKHRETVVSCSEPGCSWKGKRLRLHLRREHSEPEVGEELSFEKWDDVLELEDLRRRVPTLEADVAKWHGQRTELWRENQQMKKYMKENGLQWPPSKQ